MYRINEIFYSLQGEGHHTGYPCVFVRFAGCNLHCPFCDTPDNGAVMMTADDIIHAVNLYQVKWIVLTGGEPALHIDKALIHTLHRATRKKIAIETNGTVELPEGIDWITLSPKTGISGDVDDLPIVVDHADEIKVVDLGQDLDSYFDLPCRHENTLMYLQPCYVPDPKDFERNRLRTVRRVLADPRWTLSIQLHRYLGIP